MTRKANEQESKWESLECDCIVLKAKFRASPYFIWALAHRVQVLASFDLEQLPEMRSAPCSKQPHD
jgi:hypothetical protein